MFALFQIAFVSVRKQYWIRLLFTHKKGDFDTISVTDGAKLRCIELEGVTYRIGSVPHLIRGSLNRY